MVIRSAAFSIVAALALLVAFGAGSARAAETPASAVAAGDAHSCATYSGAVKCWGKNQYGQLGTGSTTGTIAPAVVPALSSGVTAIALGGFHSCAIRGGSAKCWGYNFNGQLGDGTDVNRTAPVGVSGLGTGIKAITAGYLHSCAILSDDVLNCWGSNTFGQLGKGDQGADKGSYTPVAISAFGAGVKAVAAGDWHTCAIDAADDAWCWGRNDDGQLGDGTKLTRNLPVKVLSGVAAITTGAYHSCAILLDGGVKCWGFNNDGQMGDASNTERTTPVDVSGLGSGVTSISAGAFHTCAIQSNAARCWGRNDRGQLGDGSKTARNTPVAVTGLTEDVSEIAAGGHHSCAIQLGVTRCWGENTGGQLGIGSTDDSSTPIEVARPPKVAISAPANGLETTDPTLVVAFSATGLPAPQCTVRGGAASSPASIRLIPGVNVIPVTCVNAAGSDSKTVTVTFFQAPIIATTTPADGALTTSARTRVSFLVTGHPTPECTINGAPATDSADVDLILGANAFSISCTNSLGADARSMNITRILPPAITSAPSRVKPGRAIPIKVSCESACRIEGSLKIGKKKVKGPKAIALRAGKSSARLVIPSKSVKAIKKALATNKRTQVTLTLKPTSLAGDGKPIAVRIR